MGVEQKAKKTSVKNGIAPLAIPGASEATKMRKQGKVG